MSARTRESRDLHCRRRVSEALKHLGTDYVDVLVLRLPGPTADCPVEAMAKEMKAGAPLTCHLDFHVEEAQQFQASRKKTSLRWTCCQNAGIRALAHKDECAHIEIRRCGLARMAAVKLRLRI